VPQLSLELHPDLNVRSSEDDEEGNRWFSLRPGAIRIVSTRRKCDPGVE
jgi:hypothetical protein